eukprot:9900972-Heterocapsa_arctica.AAC.1
MAHTVALDMELENGARDMLREKTKAEVEALTNDEKNEWKDQDFEHETEEKKDEQQIVTERGYIYDDRGERRREGGAWHDDFNIKMKATTKSSEEKTYRPEVLFQQSFRQALPIREMAA